MTDKNDTCDDKCLVGANLFPRVERNKEDIEKVSANVVTIDGKIDKLTTEVTKIQTTMKIAGVILGVVLTLFTPTVSGIITLVVIAVLKLAFGLI